MLDRARIEERRHEIEAVELALEREPVLVLERPPDVTKRLDVFTDPRTGPVVRHPEASLDVRSHLRAQAEVEPPAARALE